MRSRYSNRAYDIEISQFSNYEIRRIAKSLSITHMRSIGGGYVKGYDGNIEYYVGFYALYDPALGDEILVADINTAPIWECTNREAFADLAESCGVKL